MYSLIKSIYSNVKTCVRYNGSTANFFDVQNGLMQGEGLSPFLFSLYINDFENYLIEHALENVELKELSLFLFLYADDTVLFAESKNALQNMLDKL